MADILNPQQGPAGDERFPPAGDDAPEPCPFCDAHLFLMPSDLGERIYTHPENGCIAEDIFVADDEIDLDRWNARALPAAGGEGVRRALKCALAQLEADHDAEVAAEMFGGEPDPAKAMNINRHDVAEMIRELLPAEDL